MRDVLPTVRRYAVTKDAKIKLGQKETMSAVNTMYAPAKLKDAPIFLRGKASV